MTSFKLYVIFTSTDWQHGNGQIWGAKIQIRIPQWAFKIKLNFDKFFFLYETYIDTHYRYLFIRFLWAFKKEISYFKYSSEGVCEDWTMGYILSHPKIGLRTLQPNLTMCDTFKNKIIREKWKHMLTHMHGKSTL
jgi:hypothetical protein